MVQYFIDNGAEVRHSDNDYVNETIDFANDEKIISLLKSYGALTKEERDDIEDLIYGAFDHASKVKVGDLTGHKIIEAVKKNNIDEVKRLLSLCTGVEPVLGDE